MAIGNIAYLVFLGTKSWEEIAFRGLQYVAMLIVLQLPRILKVRFHVEVPWLLSGTIVIFCFSSLVLGDGLDLYGRLPWWDKLLHAESGFLSSMIAFWLIHIIMAEHDKYIYMNKYFLSLFLVIFSIGLGACWEIIEFSYDHLMGTNTQQFMLTTTGSIITPEDIPLCGHDALKDSMIDLILDFIGGLIVALYGFWKHDKIMERYYNDKKLFNNETI